MNKKVLIQFSLFLVVLVACFTFYRLFFKNPEIKLNDIRKDKQENKIDAEIVKEITSKEQKLRLKKKAKYSTVTQTVLPPL